MERAMVSVVGALLLLAASVVSGECMNCYPGPAQCGSCGTFVTRMVPCVRTEMVAEVQPCTRAIPVKRIGYRIQNFMLKGIPVGSPCGQDPCTKCCPQPFCQVVQRQVPYVYYQPMCVTCYNVVYRPVCRQVMVPQTYLVRETPMCGH